MHGKNAYVQDKVLVTKDEIIIMGYEENIKIDLELSELVELVYFTLKLREEEIKSKIAWYEKLIDEIMKFLTEPYEIYFEDELKIEIERVERKIDDVKCYEKIIEEYKAILSFLKRMKKYVEG